MVLPVSFSSKVIFALKLLLLLKQNKISLNSFRLQLGRFRLDIGRISSSGQALKWVAQGGGESPALTVLTCRCGAKGHGLVMGPDRSRSMVGEPR